MESYGMKVCAEAGDIEVDDERIWLSRGRGAH